MLKVRYKDMLKQGCNFRMIVLNPTSPVIPAVARAQHRSIKGLRDEINTALSVFKELQDYANIEHAPGKFDFVIFDYLPTLTLMRFENKNTGLPMIHVELPAYRADIWKRPVFHLTHTDGQLFTFFEQVCSNLWVDATTQRTVPQNKPKPSV